MTEHENEQTGRRAERRPERRPGSWARRNAAIVVCVVLPLVLLTVALANSLQRVSAADVSADAVAGSVELVELDGTYRIDGGPERPYTARQSLDAPGVGVDTVEVRGTLSADVPSGARINVRLSSTACTVRVNGEVVFASDGIGDVGPAGEPLLGWVGFPSPGISAQDRVEVSLSRATGYSALGDYLIALDSLCVGEPDALFMAAVASHWPMFAAGLVVLVSGLVLLLVASVGHLVGVPREAGGLSFALYVITAGVWIFFCFDYITLLVPFPAFTTTVSMITQDMLSPLLLAFVASRVEGRPRTVARWLSAALFVMLGAFVVLRLAGLLSLYDANVVFLFVLVAACVAASAVLAIEAWTKRSRMAVDTTFVVLPCVLGMVVEGLSFLIGGVTTGLWLTAGVLCGVAVRFVALFMYARGQVVQAERARRKEAELLQSRIAVMLSQIHPHFLFNALNTIEYLCEEDPPTAARAVNDFAQYLRGNMDSLTGSQTIPFCQELEHLAHYVAIEQLRFPSIEVTYDIRVRDFSVPPLSVQPLVENAIRYGAARRAGGGAVKVASWRDKGSFVVRVSDNGPGFDSAVLCGFQDGDPASASGGVVSDAAASRSHVGLANVAARVAATCGGTLRVENEEGGGARVTMRVPCDKEGSPR